MLKRKENEMDARNSIFQQDGSSIHTSKSVTQYLKKVWKTRWIGLKHHTRKWPPKSPDLTPLDFWFWNHVRQRVRHL